MPAKRPRWQFLPRNEHTLLCAFLIAQVATLAHFVHESYARAEVRMPAGTAACFFGACGTKYAPQAYRVGVEFLGTSVLRLSGTQHPSVVATLLDVLFWLPALYLLAAVATTGLSTTLPDRPRRLLTLTLLVAITPFALVWAVPWQRSETAPSALFVALLLCWVTRSSKRSWSVLALLAAALWQSLVRTDVAVTAGVALFLWATISGRPEVCGPRRKLQLAGLGIAAIGMGAQLVLQRIVFPHLAYEPGVRRVQLLANLRHAHQLEVAVLALLPFILLSWPVRRSLFADPLASLAALMSVLYVPLWLAFGVLQEVRLFVPFLVGWAPVLARHIAREPPALDYEAHGL